MLPAYTVLYILINFPFLYSIYIGWAKPNVPFTLLIQAFMGTHYNSLTSQYKYSISNISDIYYTFDLQASI